MVSFIVLEETPNEDSELTGSELLPRGREIMDLGT